MAKKKAKKRKAKTRSRRASSRPRPVSSVQPAEASDDVFEEVSDKSRERHEEISEWEEDSENLHSDLNKEADKELE